MSGPIQRQWVICGDGYGWWSDPKRTRLYMRCGACPCVMKRCKYWSWVCGSSWAISVMVERSWSDWVGVIVIGCRCWNSTCGVSWAAFMVIEHGWSWRWVSGSGWAVAAVGRKWSWDWVSEVTIDMSGEWRRGGSSTSWAKVVHLVASSGFEFPTMVEWMGRYLMKGHPNSENLNN